MTKIEAMQQVANIHNILASISVKGDDVILMSKAIIELRNVVKGLQDDINAEQAEAGAEKTKSEK